MTLPLDSAPNNHHIMVNPIKASNVTVKEDLYYRDHPNYQSIFNESNVTTSTMMRANDVPRDQIMNALSIKSNQILIENDMTDLQERLYTEIKS